VPPLPCSLPTPFIVSHPRYLEHYPLERRLNRTTAKTKHPTMMRALTTHHSQNAPIRKNSCHILKAANTTPATPMRTPKTAPRRLFRSAEYRSAA
jgi:hypothetical protein